jgi:hypothetical protein
MLGVPIILFLSGGEERDAGLLKEAIPISFYSISFGR